MSKEFLNIVRDRINRPLQYYQDICVRCGACVDACHFYATTGTPVHIPAQRMMMVRKALQKGNGWMAWYREAVKNDDHLIADIQQAMWELLWPDL